VSDVNIAKFPRRYITNNSTINKIYINNIYNAVRKKKSTSDKYTIVFIIFYPHLRVRYDRYDVVTTSACVCEDTVIDLNSNVSVTRFRFIPRVQQCALVRVYACRNINSSLRWFQPTCVRERFERYLLERSTDRMRCLRCFELFQIYDTA
jgi:hypothetical protein